MNEERNIEIMKLRYRGYKLREIGEKYNLSVERVRQIIKRIEYTEKNRINKYNKNNERKIIYEYYMAFKYGGK